MSSPERVVALGRRLRAEGVACALPESTSALAALAHLDPDDVEDVRLGLRTAFCATLADVEVFERCFWAWWEEETPSAVGPDLDALAPRLNASDRDEPPLEGPMEVLTEDASRDEGAERPVGAAYSPVDALARRSFATLGEQELREFDAWIDSFMLHLASRRSRRLERGGRRGPIDVRHTLRGAIRHDGELIRLTRRRRRKIPPRLVVLCDVSGSMERYSRFLMRFLLGCGRARDIQTFAFSTRLTYLTPWLAGTEVDPALARLRSRGWSSGTRIGECLEEFIHRYGGRMLGQRTLVIILSDGLDQGEVEPLERAMRRIQQRARRLIWLNPLLESSGYAPEARGMSAALPFIDHFHSGHSLRALQMLPRLLKL